MEALAHGVFEQSPGPLLSEDATFVFLFSIIMLNTDLHNPGVAKKMTLKGWFKNNKGVNTDYLVKEIPLGRFGDPQEVASLISFMCSEGASYITGQTIHINGGLYM